MSHVFYVSSGWSGIAWILAEPLLEGPYTKFNNNYGKVRKPVSRTPATPKHDSSLDLIPEGDDDDYDEECDDDEEEEGIHVYAEDVPQCFSHFTWSISDGAKLVCDIQGTWNAEDGYLLTDPAIHKVPSRFRCLEAVVVRCSVTRAPVYVCADFEVRWCSSPLPSCYLVRRSL